MIEYYLFNYEILLFIKILFDFILSEEEELYSLCFILG